GQVAQHFGKAHHREFRNVAPRIQPCGAHARTAHAYEFRVRMIDAQGFDQFGAQQVAGIFTRDHREYARADAGFHSTYQRSLAAVDEIAERANVFSGFGLFGERGARFIQLLVGHVKGTVRALDGANALAVEPAPLQAFRVHAARHRELAGDIDEGRHVTVDRREHRGERVRADLAELVHARESAQHNVVADFDMARERGIVGEDGVAADVAVVRNVRVGHDPVVVADAGGVAAFGGAAVDRDEFMEGVAVADLEPAVFA